MHQLKKSKEITFQYKNIDYYACISILNNEEYEVDTMFQGTFDMRVGKEVQKRAEDIFLRMYKK